MTVPGAERLFRQHISGTFEEIHPKGYQRLSRLVGDNYEIIAGKSNVSITGDVNLTVREMFASSLKETII